MDLSEYNQHSKTKVLVYGPPKSGKTALVGKLAEHFNLHWLDLENGIKTLLNPAILAPEFRKNVNVVPIPDHRLSPTAILAVIEIFKGRPVKLCHLHGKSNCALCTKDSSARWSQIDLGKFTDKDILVMDSISQLANSAINYITRKEIQKPGGEEYQRTFHDWANQGALMEQVLSMIQVLDMNIVCISHDIDSSTIEGTEKIVPQAGTRNFSRMSAKYFDSVVYCTIKNRSHRAYTDTTFDPTILTGSRVQVPENAKGDGLDIVSLFKKD